MTTSIDQALRRRVVRLEGVLRRAEKAMRTVGCEAHLRGQGCPHVDCAEVGIALDEIEALGLPPQ